MSTLEELNAQSHTEDEEVDQEFYNLSSVELTTRAKLLDNEIRIFRSELQRLSHENSQMLEKIKGLSFSALSASDIVAQSEVEISTRDLFDLDNGRSVKEGGALDARMGVSSSQAECTTCHGNLASCHGHFGHIKLALPVFHVGYFKATIQILQSICKSCGSLLLSEEDKRKFLLELRRPGIDNLRRMNILKKILDQCKKQRRCLHCGHLNGVVKKAAAGAGSAALKIIHDTFRWVGKKSAPEKESWVGDWKQVLENNPELERYTKRCMDCLLYTSRCV